MSIGFQGLKMSKVDHSSTSGFGLWSHYRCMHPNQYFWAAFSDIFYRASAHDQNFFGLTGCFKLMLVSKRFII